MSVIATYLINDNTGDEKFVVNLPEDYEFQPGERLVERTVSEEDFAKYILNNDDHVKVFRYVSGYTEDKTIPPFGINYKVGLDRRLYHKYEFVGGRLIKAEFYAECVKCPINEFKFNDLIICVEFEYKFDPATKYVTEREKTVCWHMEKGGEHPLKKKMHKYYSAEEADREVITARGNIIAHIKIEVAKFLAAMFEAQYPDPNTRPDSNAASKQLMASLNTPILNYINGGDPAIKAIIAGVQDPIFDATMSNGKTVRNFILEELI